MAEIVNLRQVRKHLARTAAAQQAAENRVRHGRTGAQKQADRQAQHRAARLHDDARLLPDRTET